MRILSFFSGIGGFELGIQQAYETNRQETAGKHTLPLADMPDIKSGAGEREYPIHSQVGQLQQGIQRSTDSGDIEGDWRKPEFVGYSEIDKYAISIYQRHFPEHRNYGDITKINTDDIPDIDMVVGGFPCQAFSMAGKRGGFNDTRGTLFFEVARIIKAKGPRLVWLENVKGLLNHDEGRTFRTIIGTLDELGYDIQWQVLNSKYFGVPQNRERVFIIGHLRGTPRPEVFPFRSDGSRDNEINVPGTETHEGGGEQDIEGRRGHSLYRGEIIKEGTYGTGNYQSGRQVYSQDGISPTITAGMGEGGGNVPSIKVSEISPYQGDKVTQIDQVHPTLSAQGGNKLRGVGIQQQDLKIRRLTPTECERLQGFPDGWTEGVSDTQRYKTLGNAVTVNVIREIAKKLLS